MQYRRRRRPSDPKPGDDLLPAGGFSPCAFGADRITDMSGRRGSEPIWRPNARESVRPLAELATKQLSRNYHRSVAALKPTIREFLDVETDHGPYWLDEGDQPCPTM